MEFEKINKAAELIVSVITIISIIVGGIFAMVQYLEHKKELKIKHTLEFVTKFNSDKFMDLREKINNVWNDANPVMVKILTKDKTPEAYEGFVVALVKKYKIHSEIDNIMTLFEEIAICSIENICDKQTVNKYFYDDGKIFFRKFYPYVCDLRKKWNDKKIWYKAQEFYSDNTLGTLCK